MLATVRLVAATVLLGVAACSSPPPAGGAGPADPTAATATATATVQEIQGEGVPLPPGRYTFTPFEPRVRFEVGEGFEGGHTNPEFFDVVDGEGAALAFARPSFVPAKEGDRLAVAGASAAEVLDALTEVSGFEVSNELQMTVGSQQVAAIEGIGGQDGAALFGGPGGEFGIVKGDGYRIAPIDVEGTIVLVMQMALDPPHEQAFAATEPLLPTISFDEG